MSARSMWIRASFGVLSAVLLTTGQASAQGLYNDIQRERYDEQRLVNDEYQLQRDINSGNLSGIMRDINRINNDENRVIQDQNQVQYDLSNRSYYGGVGSYYYPAQTQQQLIPHPSYPGYSYYASNPSQLYYSPATTPATTEKLIPHPGHPGFLYYPSNPNQLYYDPAKPAGTAASSTTASTPLVPNSPPPANTLVPNAPPAQKTSVAIINPDDSKVAINFNLDGVTYNVPSGYTQVFRIKPSSIIEFDRGSEFGAARFTLTPGRYEFGYGDSGWNLVKKPEIAKGLIANAAPANAVPATPAVNPVDKVETAATVQADSKPVEEVVPPVPTPAPPGPR